MGLAMRSRMYGLGLRNNLKMEFEHGAKVICLTTSATLH